MASTSTTRHNETQPENTFEQPEQSSEPRQNLNCLMEIIKLLQEWCRSIQNDLERICSVRFRRFALAPGVSRQTPPDTQYAFDQLAPISVSTSTEPWQIFINHRGSDVKYTLASEIHQRLEGMGFRAFLDVEVLKPGDCIPAELQHAITSATLHIAIFSPNYAQSPWCLAELSFMLKTGAKIIPIFHHVHPSDLRWVHQGKGKYARAFSEHLKKGRYTQEKLNEWKTALNEISFRSGFEVDNNEGEARVLKNIVNSALEVMNKNPLPVADHPIGLDELVQSFPLVASEQKVKIAGIVGMGGSGKTTLAKELFNRNFSSFERCSFVHDVRDAASRNALPEKQKKLLKDLGVPNLLFDSVDEGKAILANLLSSLRALIVLDDVDHIDHLNCLLPNKDNLGSQSMVIVTSRELGVLESWGLSCIYKMPGLDRSHAMQLFCWHAFLQPSPPAEFETLVQDFLKACNGLPLSLKVLGAQLYGRKSKDYWKSLLHKISRILPDDITKRLQVSYDALDVEEKEMFLDVACFLIGEFKSTAIAMWDGSDWSGLHGLQTLVNKCLVELVYEEGGLGKDTLYRDKIRMHDHLRDMGREIASRHSSYRLWRPEHIHNMKHFKKEMPIRGIRPPDTFVAFKEYTRRLMGVSSRFSNGLQILHVKGNEFTKEFASLSEHLVWLRWKGFPLKNLPPWLTLKHLSVLEIEGANVLEELWDDNVDPPLQLRELTIRVEGLLQRLPSSVGRFQYLKKVALNFNGSSLPEEFCGLHSLEYLYLYSPMLSSLSAGFGKLISLRKIILVSCKQLTMLPDSFEQLIHLEHLSLSNGKMLSSLPDGFGNLKSLKHINLESCKQLSTLPDSFKQLIHLEDLDISSCDMLSSLPDGFGNLKSLKHIKLGYCKQLSMLPDSFKQLIHLEDLNISSCDMLSSLPDGFGNLKSLKHIELGYCKQLSMLPDSFKQLIHLEDLDISRCDMLSSLPDGFGNLKSLKHIKLNYCKQLSMLPDSFKQLIHLEDLRLSGCEMLSSLPDGFGNLKSLKHIDLENCKQLSTLPDSFKQLIHLESLNISGCAKLKLKSNVLENIRTLKVLRLSGCKELEELPHQIVNQASLTELDLTGCIKLRGLPTNIGELAKLESLKCESLMLKSLQISLVDLSSLKMIKITNSLGEMHFDAGAEDCKQVSTISISNDCCPILQTVEVEENFHLMEIEILPLSLRGLSISKCKVLKNIGCISGLVSLENLFIYDCPQIELPSFADLASLKFFKMEDCPKVEKIKGLEHSKSLKKLQLRNTCWKVPGIQSLEKVKRLELLVLECDTISALKPFIQSMKIKGCPRTMTTQGSVSRVVVPIVNSSEFPDLSVSEVEKLSDVDKIVTSSGSAACFCYVEGKQKSEEERKVVRIFVCLDGYRIWYLVDFGGRVNRGKIVVVTGRRGRVVDAFYQLLALLE